MSAQVDVGTGATFTLAGVTYNIESMEIGDITRDAIDTTHLNSTPADYGSGEVGGREFILPSLFNPGTITLNCQFDPSIVPPISQPAANAEINFAPSGGNTTGAKWAFSAGVVGFGASVPLEDKMTCVVTIEVAGEITVTPGS